ncbi:hypothetical protein DEU56DRAFT_916557 [Suillus clintonianus]|uniref:uncharacterized protein n=1 Tax=Suillus clintonianus TaxID=1904413 RepID=UPI001B85E093|nr:uncharacterized protein DEU56DRAFT_916557 [Suillus clintonianus]KAG2125394.1 hypothetical protein DEU56DRAFT_916557 [Suillus clintonianus]
MSAHLFRINTQSIFIQSLELSLGESTSIGIATFNQMNNKEYTQLAQEEEEEQVLQRKLPLEADGACPQGTKRFASPWWIAIALVAFLAINGLCLIIMNSRLRAASKALVPLLDFTDTRHLPRPDQYDGL